MNILNDIIHLFSASKNKKRKKTINKKPLKDAKLLSKKEYESLLLKKKKKQKLTKKQKKQLDHNLFIKYCQCIKSLKNNTNFKKGLEYPICMSSIYTKRNIKPPKNIKKKCKKYK
jgi:hypothetical protein